MSLLEAIKGPKTLTFKHWRYRLLHWCFGISPSCPSDSHLPHFMYTHYCPLFHVTNMIALFSPIILLIRFTALLFRAFTFVFMAIASPTVDGFNALWKALAINLPEKKEREPRPLTEYQKKQLDIQLIHQQVEKEGYTNFAHFWHHHGAKLFLMEETEAETYFTALVDRVQTERERKEASEKAWRAFFTKMVVVSRVLIKGLLYITYAALAVGLVAGVYYGTMPFLSFLGSVGQWIGGTWTSFLAMMSDTFTTEFILTVLTWTGIALGGFMAAVLMVATALKIRLGAAIGNGLEATTQASAPFVHFFTRVVSWPFVSFWKICVGIKEFIGMFYEENCPPITIVKED